MGWRGGEKMGFLQPRYGTSCWTVRPECKVLWALESRGPWCPYQGGQQVRWDTVSSRPANRVKWQGLPAPGEALGMWGPQSLGGWYGDGLQALLCPVLSTPPVLFQYPDPQGPSRLTQGHLSSSARTKRLDTCQDTPMGQIPRTLAL